MSKSLYPDYSNGFVREQFSTSACRVDSNLQRTQDPIFGLRSFFFRHPAPAAQTYKDGMIETNSVKARRDVERLDEPSKGISAFSAFFSVIVGMFAIVHVREVLNDIVK